jgi:hypothetical protein
MTHDELLARIKEKGSANLATLKHNPDGQKNIQDVFKALRAVLELHKPYSARADWIQCHVCYEVTYPCPTIQAIEKESK